MAKGMIEWHPWWKWELELSSHLLKRMLDREFSEVELRTMMECATGYRRDEEPGRWVIEARHRSSPREVIVEPDTSDRLLVVITAFPAESA